MLTWSPPPATGLGDRMGGWMVLFALGWLRNESVWLNWAPGWFRLPALFLLQDEDDAVVDDCFLRLFMMGFFLLKNNN